MSDTAATGIELYRWRCFDEGEPAPKKAEHPFKPLTDRAQDSAKTLEEARAEAKEIIARAEAQAEAIRQEAEKIKAAAATEGRQEGRSQGLAEGTKEGRDKFTASAAPVIKALNRFENLYQDLWAANEVELVELALTVARRVVMRELETSPELVVEAFKAAVTQLDQQHQAVFRLHPDDLELLQSSGDELKDKVGGLVKLSFEPDPNLARGGLIMETEAGRLDATLRSRIQAVTEAVEEVLADKFDLDW